MASSVVIARPAAAPSAAPVSATDSLAWKPAAARTARIPSMASKSPSCRPVRWTTSSSTGLSPRLRSTRRWSYRADARWSLSADCSRHTTATTAPNSTGTRSARTTSFKTLALGTVRIVAPAGTGANGTATGATDARTASPCPANPAVDVPGLIEKLPRSHS